ncbi:response regulator transcription factor [Niastella caeni]|nr:response regulator transcription factor [Niastella caeni]
MTTNEKIKILIIDDHRLFSDGLCAMLQPEPGIEVLSRIYDSREALRAIRELEPEIVLVDFNMPYINGLELTRLLLENHPNLKILILSMYHEERYTETFRKSGIRGYLFKTVSAEDVILAIQTVHSGGFYFPNTSGKSNHADDNFLKALKLSPRELEVITLIKAGLKTKEIAEKLNLSFYTVETHRKNIKLKAGLKGENDFLRFIYEL